MPKQKLSPEQDRVLKHIKEEIAIAKKYNNYRDYYNEIEGPDYPIPYQDYDTVLARDGEEKANQFKKYWELNLENKALTICSSHTIKALEKKGYIRILRDGKRGCDIIELIEE